MEEVEYTLLQIDVHKPEITELPLSVDLENVQWRYSFFFSFSEYGASKILVQVNVHLSLYRTDDPERKSMSEIKTQSQFKVTRSISRAAKLHVLYRFLNITMWNLQGAYAAKTEHTPLADILPAEPHFREEEELLKKQINEHWS